MFPIAVGLLLLSTLCWFYGAMLHRSIADVDPLSAARPAPETLLDGDKAPTEPSPRMQQARKYASRIARRLSWIPQPYDLNQQLAWAGKQGKMSEQDFRTEQVLYMFAIGLIGLAVGIVIQNSLLQGIVLMIAFGAVGLYFPVYELNRDGARRQTEITQTLPDAVDLISTSVSAGLSVDRAITYTCESMVGPLQEELTTFLQELQLGVPRMDAYQHLMERNKSDEMHIIVGALMQGQSLGVPISETLDVQADAMRERRLHRAKEIGGNASPRITTVMTICIIPSVLLMFGAVIIYSIISDTGSMFGNFGG